MSSWLYDAKLHYYQAPKNVHISNTWINKDDCLGLSMDADVSDSG